MLHVPTAHAHSLQGTVGAMKPAERGRTSQCHMPTAFMTIERPSMYARMPITCAKKKGRGVT